MIIKDVKARKEYICDICDKPIQKGEVYTMLTSEPNDWDWETIDETKSPYVTFHRHKKCNTMWEMLLAYFDDDEYNLGMAYWEGIYDVIPEIFNEYEGTMIFEELIQLYNTAQSGEDGKKKVVGLFTDKGYSSEEVDEFLDFIKFLNERMNHEVVMKNE